MFNGLEGGSPEADVRGAVVAADEMVSSKEASACLLLTLLWTCDAKAPPTCRGTAACCPLENGDAAGNSSTRRRFSLVWVVALFAGVLGPPTPPPPPPLRSLRCIGKAARR